MGSVMKIEKHNIVSEKLDYAMGKRPPVECILCAVAAGDPKVENLVVYRHGDFFVTLNLYPYNPGHVMVAPSGHVEDLREFSDGAVLEMHRLQLLCLSVLDDLYRPAGYNMGYNMGRASGASITHLHLQIVPRYSVELGFFDILSDSRVIVEEPPVSRERMRKLFAETGEQFLSER